MKQIIFIDNTAHHLYGQLHLINAFANRGYVINLLCPNDNNYFIKLHNLGFKCVAVDIDGKGINPVTDYKLIQQFKIIFSQIKPKLVISFTVKPNLYGAIAAKKYNISIIPNITGLGYVFTGLHVKFWLRFIVIQLYKFAFKDLIYVMFQNNDDKTILESFNIFSKNTNLCVLPGDGVDIHKFYYVGYNQKNNYQTKFLFSGRLLWDKGLGELIDSMRVVKNKYPNVILNIIGNFFPANPSSIDEDIIIQWQNQGLCQYLGMAEDVPHIISMHDCVILPSYREGMPRALLEASSMGKPIITVDSIGCKDAVIDNITGLVAQVKNSNSLAQSMIKFIEMTFEEKYQMGINARKFIVDKFNQQLVVDKYLSIDSSI